MHLCAIFCDFAHALRCFEWILELFRKCDILFSLYYSDMNNVLRVIIACCYVSSLYAMPVSIETESFEEGKQGHDMDKLILDS
jgi:hypothetical protein